MRHYNIPVFIPELACPFRCIYCNQYNISGVCRAPGPSEVVDIIEKHLATIPPEDSETELAFFGGSFTGLSVAQQNMYLDVAKPWIGIGRITGIRISTRPDYINPDILKNLKKKHVTSIELGAQSLNDNVLKRAGRGHTVEQVKEATGLLLDMGFETGLQMMTGLPGDSDQSAIETAQMICDLKVHTTRIYPTLVIEDTDLAQLYRQGLYIPQSLEDAADLSARLYLMFERGGIKVLRMGLHTTESFYDGGSLLAGPFHPAFGEIAMTRVWYHRLKNLIPEKGNHIKIEVHPSQLNALTGHHRKNRIWLEEKFSNVDFYSSSSLLKHEFHLNFS
jgi:histone acetyltransferase (RNA polymerase elongator complex component)